MNHKLRSRKKPKFVLGDQRDHIFFSRYRFSTLSTLFGFALVAGQIALAQNVAKIEPVAHPKYPSIRIATAQGYTGPNGNSFSIANLALSQPIIIFVSESMFGHRVRVDLAKFDDFLEPLRTCQTTPTKACLVQTRTDGDLFIRVKSLDQAEAEYFVAVWEGAESKKELPSLFTPSRGATALNPASSATSVAPPNGAEVAEQMTAKFFAYNAGRKMLVVKDAVGTTFEFLLPSEAKLDASGKVVRADEYLKAHFDNLPYASDQQLQIVWKPSPSGKGRVVIDIRGAL
jgi:hypothetical protein